MEADVRVIQYLGSKLQILNDIETEIEMLLPEGGIVCDAFSGSGVVAYKLAQKYTVYANDIQEYAKVISDVLLQVNRDNCEDMKTYQDIINTDFYIDNKNKLESIFGQALEYERSILECDDYDKLAELCELNLFYDGSEIQNKNREKAKKIFGKAIDCFSIDYIQQLRENKEFYALFTLYFLNSYFSLEQCVEIDSLRYALDKLLESKQIERYEYEFLIVCLIHSISEVVSSVGKNFAQPIKVTDKKGKIKPFAIKRSMRDRKLKIGAFFENIQERLINASVISRENKTFCMNTLDLLSLDEMESVDVFYLDPPYTTDHYSRFYHILETLVKYDYPKLEKMKLMGKVKIMNGKYRDDRFQSNYCIPSKGYDEFERLISKIHSLGARIVMSYSEDDSDKDTRKRVINKQELVEMLKKYYTNVCVKNLEHRYKKLSAKDNNRKEMNNSELLIICR